MSDQTLSFWTKTNRPQRPVGYQQILGGLCFVLLCAVHPRLSFQTLRQELPLREMCERILRLWPGMGWRPVPPLSREVQVSVLSLRLPPLKFHEWPARGWGVLGVLLRLNSFHEVVNCSHPSSRDHPDKGALILLTYIRSIITEATQTFNWLWSWALFVWYICLGEKYHQKQNRFWNLGPLTSSWSPSPSVSCLPFIWVYQKPESISFCLHFS